jgi:hemerythrin-like domain-containing protein
MGILPNQAPLASFDDPLGVLVDCHRRIERFAGVLHGVALRGALLDDESRAALGKALEYFREAAPRHTADEEDSLFRRLARLPQARAELERLSAEHAAIEALQARADELGRAWLAAGALAQADRAEFESVASELVRRYAEHIASEERVLLPLARERLDPLDLLSIGVEMRMRRDR